MALFGSYSRNTAVKGISEIDLVVKFSESIGIRFIHLADELEQIPEHKANLVSRNGMKPKYFNVIKPDLIYI